MSKYYVGTFEIGKRIGFSKSHTNELIKKGFLRADNLSTTGNYARYRCSEEDIQDFIKRFEEADRDTSKMVRVVAPKESTKQSSGRYPWGETDLSSLMELVKGSYENQEKLDAMREKLKTISETALELAAMCDELSKI